MIAIEIRQPKGAVRAHFITSKLPYFARKNANMAYLKKHGLKLAFFASKFRSRQQKRGNPGPYRVPLGSVTLVSVVRTLTYCPVSPWKAYRKNEGIIRVAMAFQRAMGLFEGLMQRTVWGKFGGPA